MASPVTQRWPIVGRALPLILLAYGALGAMVIVLVLAVGVPALGRLDRLMQSADATLVRAAQAVSGAAAATDGFGTSLEQARSSADSAATLSREASATSASLADAMSISVFGAQPLISLADDFRATSEQLDGLAADLDGIGAALVSNDDDLARLGVQLRSLARELSRLRYENARDSGEPGIALSALLFAFLLWQSIPTVASLAAGIALLRRPAR